MPRATADTSVLYPRQELRGRSASATVPPAWKFALALGAAAILLSGTLLGFAPNPESRVASAHLQLASTSFCSALTTNASLVALVATHYPNASLEPSETTASASIAQVWGTVCSSSTLVDAETQQANVTFATSVYVGDSNGSGQLVTSGSLFVQFSLAWTAACPDVSTAYPAGYPCDFTDGWTGNLSTGAIDGPVHGIVSVRYAGCALATDSYLVGTVNLAYPDAYMHPNQTVADRVVETIWGEICSSLAFYQATVAHPGLGLSLGVSNAGTGLNQTPPVNETLQVSWDFQWPAACPAGNSSYPAGGSCQYVEAWGANLATDRWWGPSTTVYVSISTGGPHSPQYVHCWGCSEPSQSLPLVVVLGASGALTFTGVLLVRRRGPRDPTSAAPPGAVAVRASPSGPTPVPTGGTPDKSSEAPKAASEGRSQP